MQWQEARLRAAAIHTHWLKVAAWYMHADVSSKSANMCGPCVDPTSSSFGVYVCCRSSAGAATLITPSVSPGAAGSSVTAHSHPVSRVPGFDKVSSSAVGFCVASAALCAY